MSIPMTASQVLDREFLEIRAKVPDGIQERIINWGYAICDAAMRAHVEATSSERQFPYPATPS